jgi:hypothetical protein
MSRLDDALKRFEQVATLGMRESDYIQVSDSLAWFREDLAVVKTALSKKDELLGLKNKMINAYQAYLASVDTHDRVYADKWKNEIFKLQNEVYTLEKELGEMK